MSGLLIAPTEPTRLREVGATSSLPETYGVDVMWGTQHGLCGIQRKEFNDLLASMQDGRLVKEIAQMQALEYRCLVVERMPTWTPDGELMSQYQNITRSQFKAYLMSVRARGVWIDFTSDLSETIEFVDTFRRWTAKPVHRSLSARPKPQGAWGRTDSHDYSIHLLTSFEGIGAGTAEKILSHFGRVPLKWDVTEEELQEVEGIGKVRAKRMMEALDGERV